MVVNQFFAASDKLNWLETSSMPVQPVIFPIFDFFN